MAYDTFIPELWSKSIERNLERLCVFAEDCNRQYEGQVKGPGDTVHILGAARPTITRIARANANAKINPPEELNGTDDTLVVNQMAYYNYMVGDIDKAQAVDSLMDSLTLETAEAMANEIDTYISSFAINSQVNKLFTAPAVLSDTKADAGYVLKVLDAALEQLYTKDVKPTTEIVATVSPRFFTVFKNAYIDRSTNNAEIMKNGKVAMYGGLTIKMSNNVHRTDDGATDNIMIRTKRALAFVNPFTHSEAYRPEGHFADAVKGYSVFDAKIMRPDEILNINVKYE